MEQAEVNKELEILTNKFVSMISDHFKSKNIDVNLENVDFSILYKKKINNELNLQIDEINLKTYKIITRCRKNDQGQWVCP